MVTNQWIEVERDGWKKIADNQHAPSKVRAQAQNWVEVLAARAEKEGK